MSNKALLVFCPMANVHLPPMGVAYIAGFLEQNGVSCDILDLNITLFDKADSRQKKLWDAGCLEQWAGEDSFLPIKESFRDYLSHWAEHIVNSGFSVVGFSLVSGNVLFSIALAEEIRQKNPSVCIVFGGPSCNFTHYASQRPFRFLSSPSSGNLLIREGTVDYIVLGEGELAFLEIFRSVNSGKPVKSPNIVRAACFEQPARSPEFIDNLDALPYPAWDKLPLDKYSLNRELPVLFSRGCRNNCAFCNDWLMWGARYRFRSAENIFNEMKWLYERFKRKTFRCNDLMFNGDLKMLDDLASRIIDSGMDIHWSGQGVIRTDMEHPFLIKLKLSGFTDVVYGIESLSDPVLRAMNKSFTYGDAVTVLKRTRAAGIGVHINLIVGFPGETEEEFLITKKRLTELRDLIDGVTSMNPCYLTANAVLERCPDKFSISFDVGKDLNTHWRSKDGKNTWEVRQERVRDLVAFLGNLNIKNQFTPVYDDGRPKGNGARTKTGFDLRGVLRSVKKFCARAR